MRFLRPLEHFNEEERHQLTPPQEERVPNSYIRVCVSGQLPPVCDEHCRPARMIRSEVQTLLQPLSHRGGTQADAWPRQPSLPTSLIHGRSALATIARNKRPQGRATSRAKIFCAFAQVRPQWSAAERTQV